MRSKPVDAPGPDVRTGAVVALCCALSSLASAAEVAPVASASLTITSDYVLRGVSQSKGDPALQGSVDVCCMRGWSAGVWGSNVDFVEDGAPADGATLEVDLYVARTWSLGGSVSLDTLLTRYVYPGTAPGIDYDYNEAVLTLHAGERISTRVYYSNDAYNSGSAGVGYELSGRQPLPGRLELEALYGYYDLDRVFEDSYAYYSLGLTRPVAGFVLGMRYESGDAAGERLWGADAEGRFVVRISTQL